MLARCASNAEAMKKVMKGQGRQSSLLFYERLGGRIVAETVVEIGGKQLFDGMYAWSDFHQGLFSGICQRGW